jgi:hypothetical protein
MMLSSTTFGYEKVGCGTQCTVPGSTTLRGRRHNTYETKPLTPRATPGATTTSRLVTPTLYKSGESGWNSVEEQAWDEVEAVLLLQNAGALVAGLEATGARMPQRERYHARLVAAHDARDMAAYRIALNGYVAAAREAYRKKKHSNQREVKPDAP